MSLGNNPFINKPKYKYGAIPFDVIKQEHFIPALDYSIETAEKNLESINNLCDLPTIYLDYHTM